MDQLEMMLFETIIKQIPYSIWALKYVVLIISLFFGKIEYLKVVFDILSF